MDEVARTDRQARTRASETPRAWFRLPALRDQRSTALGLVRKTLRRSAQVFRATFRRQLLPACLHGGERPEPHPGQVAEDGNLSTLCRMRPALPARRRSAPTRVGDWC